MSKTTDPARDDVEYPLCTTTAVQRLLFGELPSTNPSAAVVLRVRAAIGLGFLIDGDRLPPEAGMAQQLGVTDGSFRKALAVLREQGLIATRAGRNGGSFVTVSEEPEALAQVDFERISAADIRDLGDWQRMLLREAASLAAARASEVDIGRLTSQAKLIASATESAHAQRAYGRFRVDLAIASQSLRLSRAEFSGHEESDRIFGLLFKEADHRARISLRLLTIVDAIESRNADSARTMAEQHSVEMLESLLSDILPGA